MFGKEREIRQNDHDHKGFVSVGSQEPELGKKKKKGILYLCWQVQESEI